MIPSSTRRHLQACTSKPSLLPRMKPTAARWRSTPARVARPTCRPATLKRHGATRTAASRLGAIGPCDWKEDKTSGGRSIIESVWILGCPGLFERACHRSAGRPTEQNTPEPGGLRPAASKDRAANFAQASRLLTLLGPSAFSPQRRAPRTWCGACHTGSKSPPYRFGENTGSS